MRRPHLVAVAVLLALGIVALLAQSPQPTPDSAAAAAVHWTALPCADLAAYNADLLAAANYAVDDRVARREQERWRPVRLAFGWSQDALTECLRHVYAIPQDAEVEP